jgi:hypothetical protein
MKDNLSGLMWIRDVSPLSTICGGGDNTAWSDAIDFVTCLNNNNHLGYNDWRLPNVNELATLINLGSDDPVNWLKTEGFNIGYSANGYKYWSSTSCPETAQRALIGWLDQWAVTWLPYESAASIWPVRLGTQDSVDPSYLLNIWKTGQTDSFHSFDDGYFERGILWPSPRFSDGGNGTIHDNLTGLTWSRNSNAPGPAGCKTGTIMTWPEALAYAQCLNSNSYLGHSDWRIPNRWELGSLIDRSQYNPPLPAGHLFENVRPGEYWTSTTIETLPTSVWTINMHNCETCVGGNGTEETGGKTETRYVWPVRGGAFTVTATVTNGHGTVSPNTQVLDYNSTATIAITPDAQYHVSKIMDNGSQVAVVTPYVIKNLGASHRVEVSFATGTFLLNVTTAGSGTGTFSAPGLTCTGAVCSGEYAPNALVSIAATANAGSTFAGWTGCDSTSGATCTVVMNGNRSVAAIFTINSYTITASVSGGHGRVTPASQRVSHGASGSITITPDPKYNASAITDNGVSMRVVGPYAMSNVTADRNVVVTFSTKAMLSVEKTGSGTGRVVAAGINCGGKCAYSYNNGRKVTLTARPQNDSYFAGWSGGGCTGTKRCVVTMNQYAYVTATFVAKEYTVSAVISGGHGTVNPMTQQVRHGQTASIAISPDGGYEIVRITDNGRRVRTANPYITSKVTRARSVVVTLGTTFPLTVTKAGPAEGVVVSAPSGILCGSTCTRDFRSDTRVVLRARAGRGSLFTGWSGGGCSGTKSCIVTMNAAIGVTANFSIRQGADPSEGEESDAGNGE